MRGIHPILSLPKLPRPVNFFIGSFSVSRVFAGFFLLFSWLQWVQFASAFLKMATLSMTRGYPSDPTRAPGVDLLPHIYIYIPLQSLSIL